MIRESNTDGSIWKIVILEGGKSKNNYVYSKDVIRESIPLFEGLKVYAHRYGDLLDHRPAEFSNPNSFYSNEVGFLKNVAFEDSGDGRLIGDFYVTDSRVRESLLNTWKMDKSQMPGFSIDIEGSGQKIGNLKHVLKIKEANSLDIVSSPSAGGQFERLVASLEIKQKEFQMKKFLNLLLAMAKAGNLKIKESVHGLSDDKIMALIKSQLGIKDGSEHIVESDMLEKLKGLLTLDGDQLKTALQELITAWAADDAGMQEAAKKKEDEAAPAAPMSPKESATMAKTLEEIQKAQSNITLEGILIRESELSEKAKERVRKSFEGKIYAAPAVYAAIKEEKEYLGQILESVETKKAGYIKVTSTPSDKLALALDVMVDPDIVHDEQFKESYKDVRPFHSMQEAIKRIDGLDVGQFLMADRAEKARIMESTTSNFTVALGDSMNKRLIRDYNRLKMREVWSKFVTEENFSNLNQQKLFRIGGFQDLDTVAEAGAYQETNTPAETEPTYTPIKKGNVFTLTEEMIINDNLNALRAFPAGMARAANRTLTKFVFNLLIGGDGSDNLNIQTIYDGKALYHNDHGGNITPNTFSYSTFDTGVQAMMNQTEDTGSDEPVGIRAKYLIISPALRRSAWDATVNELVQANANGGSIQNALKDYGVEPLVVPVGYLGNKPNAWFLVGDPQDAEGIRIGYLNGKRDPEILLQDQPLLGSVFTNDQIKYRVKFRYGGAVVDYRPFYAGIVN